MKTATTLDEQIAILVSRGLIINDKQKAKEVLLDIGFYRLGLYTYAFEESFPKLENRTHELRADTNLNDVLTLYYFDYDLRKILMNYLNRIEVNIRTYITYVCSIKYKSNNTWFVDSNILKADYVSAFDKEVYNRLRRNPIITRHHAKYPLQEYAPAWKTLEFMTLGSIVILMDSLLNQTLKREIANYYGCTLTHFFNYLRTIRKLRNDCAHGACIYNLFLPQRILSKGPAGVMNSNSTNIAGAIAVIDFFIGRVSLNRQKDMRNELTSLVDRVRKESNNTIIHACATII